MDKDIQDMLNDLPNKKFSKFSDKQLEGYENLYGLKRSEHTIQKMSAAQKNKVFTDDAKTKMSLSAKGRTSFNKGKKFNDEYKKKLSDSHKGKKHLEETKKKMSESHKGKIPANKGKNVIRCDSKTIICYSYPKMEFIKEFDSVSIASKELNLQKSCINLTCTGERKYTCGYTFRYKD